MPSKAGDRRKVIIRWFSVDRGKSADNQREINGKSGWFRGIDWVSGKSAEKAENQRKRDMVQHAPREQRKISGKSAGNQSRIISRRLPAIDGETSPKRCCAVPLEAAGVKIHPPSSSQVVTLPGWDGPGRATLALLQVFGNRGYSFDFQYFL